VGCRYMLASLPKRAKYQVSGHLSSESSESLNRRKARLDKAYRQVGAKLTGQ
jgi:ABC-type phosphate transport system auxiliary subunit